MTTAISRVCALCRQTHPLEQSHIIPKFVYRWLKETGTGVLRRNDNPNRRHQDGEQLELLCRGCENTFSGWERDFANHAFHPFHNAPRGTYVPFQHGAWGLKFATSLSWRAVQWLKTTDGVSTLPEAKRQELSDAEGTWRRFLLGEIDNPGRFEQRLFRLGEIASLPQCIGDISPGLNQYWMRGSDIDVVDDGEQLLFIYTKFGRFALAGLVSNGPRDLGGYKIRVRKGQMPKLQSISIDFMRFLNSRSEIGVQARAALTNRERQKNLDLAQRKGDAYFTSDAHTAVVADLRLHGLREIPFFPEADEG